MGAGQPGGLPMPTLASAKDVRKEANDRSVEIFKNFTLLQKILERHEGLIQKRWRKKTQSQRLKILHTAWGSPMSKTHRPDFDAFRKESELQREAGTRRRQAFIWPYINEEDLTKPRNLLLLLNARGHHSPAMFAAADSEAMHLGLVSKALVPVFLNEHVMLFRGGTGPSTYGRLISWEEHPDAFEWMHTRKEHLPGEGLLILEAQERLMSFLVDCVKNILLDMSQDELLQCPVQPTPQISEHETGFASLASMAAEAPYRVPSQLDFENIETSLLAKRDEAMDHLWNLREDPGYFNECMRDSAEHRQEVIKDAFGKVHPSVKATNGLAFWGRVLNNEITRAYLSVETWSKLAEQATKLKEMQSKYKEVIKTEDDLPTDYLHALLKFRHWLNQCAKGPMNMLKIATVASPPWRPYFERMPASDATETKMSISPKSGNSLDQHQQQLMWLLRILWEDGQELFFAGMVNVVDELQRLLDTSPGAKAMITSYVADQIADLSIVAQCLRQIDGYHPWATTFEGAMVDVKDTITQDFNRQMKTSGQILATCKQSEKTTARHGAPNQINLYYPADKRASQENIDAMRSAEAELDRFWMIFDAPIKRNVDHFDKTMIHALLTGPRTFHRTPAWVEPQHVKGSNGSTKMEKHVASLSEKYQDLERRTESTLQELTKSADSKAKVKTRGVSAKIDSSTMLEEASMSDDKTRQQKSVFAVDQRALKVFKTLFYTPSVTATPGETSWTDFLHAMVSTGFEPKKLHGSMWQFASTVPGAKRSIIFHEPHPSGKIPYLIARRHGRRLNRVYGWHTDNFVLAAK